MQTTSDTIHPIKSLPGGTITFLFTDIEGSTRLLHILGDQYAQVLALQRQLLRTAFGRWEGQEVDTQGDAFFYAFSRASDAIAAAAQAQESIASQSWPGGSDIKVRMGVHTGEARLTDEGYVGVDVHRAARICSAGYGGQILISASTATLVVNTLPKGLHLRDLGEHRLKDLSYPEHIYQLVLPGLPSDFPELKSLNARPNNLPVQLTSFIGRQDEIVQLKQLLKESRLVTIAGPGGSGKSRLSLQAAAELIDQFPDGVWYVPLGNIDSANKLPSAIANILHFQIDTYASQLSPTTQLTDYLSRRTILLVLDNFEHLLDSAAFLTSMLAGAPYIKLLLTSREILNIPEEWVFNLSGLSFPHNGHLEDDAAFSALLLFTERARQANPKFVLSAAERRFANMICRLVGGMPLGIELAAPWTAILSCQDIAHEIEQNLDFLKDTVRGIPEGHRSLRAVFEQSWRYLSEPEQAAFCNLSVFQGGFDRLAAQNVADVDLHLLMDLVKKSLVQRTEGDRFQMHALLHQFATERLQINPELESTLRERHSRYYLKVLEQWLSSKPGDNWLPVLEKVRLEDTNFAEMIRWAIIHWNEEETRWTITILGPIYLAQGFFDASVSYQSLITFLLENGVSLYSTTGKRSVLLNCVAMKAIYDAMLGDPKAEEAAKECSDILRDLDLPYELGSCLYTLGVAAQHHADYPRAIELLEEAQRLIQDSANPEILAGCFIWLGWAYHELGNSDKAKSYYDEAFQTSMSKGVGVLAPYAFDKLGLWADAIGDFKKGMEYHREALRSFRRLGSQSGQAYALSRISASAYGLGDYSTALQCGQEGYECFKAIGHRWGISTSLGRIGLAQLGLKNYSEARDYFLQGLATAQQYQMPVPLIQSMIGLSILAARQGNAEAAVEMLTVALNHPITPSPYKAMINKELAVLATELGAEKFNAAQQRGQALELQTILDRFKPVPPP